MKVTWSPYNIAVLSIRVVVLSPLIAVSIVGEKAESLALDLSYGLPDFKKYVCGELQNNFTLGAGYSLFAFSTMALWLCLSGKPTAAFAIWLWNLFLSARLVASIHAERQP